MHSECADTCVESTVSVSAAPTSLFVEMRGRGLGESGQSDSLMLCTSRARLAELMKSVGSPKLDVGLCISYT